MHKRVVMRALASVALVVFSVGCGGGSSAGTGSKAPYLISISTDLSAGFSAVAGIPYAEGFEAYFTHVNSQGGINGHKVQMDILDDRSDVQAGLANYQKELNTNSLGFFLTAASAVNSVLGPKASQDHFPFSTPIYNGGANIPDYVYDFNLSASMAATALTKYVTTKVTTPNPKVAFLSYDTPSQRANVPPISEALKAKGFTTVYNEYVPQTTVDFASSGAAIANLKPDFVVLNLLDTQFAQGVQAVRSRGYTGPISNLSAVVSDATWKKINDPNVVEPVAVPSLSDADIPATKDLKQIAAETGHTQGSSLPAWVLTYVHAEVVGAALAKCGDSCTREKLNTALSNTTIDANGLMVGRPGYTPTDKTMEKGLAIIYYDAAKGYTTTVQGFGFDQKV